MTADNLAALGITPAEWEAIKEMPLMDAVELVAARTLVVETEGHLRGARISRDKRKARLQADAVARAARAADAERRHLAQQKLAKAEAGRRQLENLMRPGNGR